MKEEDSKQVVLSYSHLRVVCTRCKVSRRRQSKEVKVQGDDGVADQRLQTSNFFNGGPL